MKGIVLAGGTGSRLWPLTRVVSKQLLPIYDKPLIFYPISTLMLAGIRDILIISTPQDLPRFESLLGDGSPIGVNFKYAIQEQPRGLAEAFIIGESFIEDDQVALVLGDNIFHGSGLGRALKKSLEPNSARIFAYKVSDPQRYGVIELNGNLEPVSIYEKPSAPRSKFAIPGLYFYDNDVIKIAKTIRPSNRNELEITSINQHYLTNNRLQVTVLDRGTAWFDTGTIDSLNSATQYVHAIQTRQDTKIACLEEIAWANGWMTKDQFFQSALGYSVGSEYRLYLEGLR